MAFRLDCTQTYRLGCESGESFRRRLDIFVRLSRSLSSYLEIIYYGREAGDCCTGGPFCAHGEGQDDAIIVGVVDNDSILKIETISLVCEVYRRGGIVLGSKRGGSRNVPGSLQYY
jgi:hypothetical protein